MVTTIGVDTMRLNQSNEAKARGGGAAEKTCTQPTVVADRIGRLRMFDAWKRNSPELSVLLAYEELRGGRVRTYRGAHSTCDRDRHVRVRVATVISDLCFAELGTNSAKISGMR